jgi:hypothetical protein
VQSLPVSGFFDCGDDLPRYEDAPEEMVLDNLLDGSAEEWCIDAFIAADA